MKDKGFNDLINDIRKSGSDIERVASQLKAQGLPEHVAYYSASMAFLRSRRR